MAFVTTLQTHVTNVQRDLHDSSGNFYSPSDLQTAINEARRKLCEDTGCLRQLQATQLAYNQESYQFGSVTGLQVVSGGTNYTNPTITIASSSGVTATGTAHQVNGVIQTATIVVSGTQYQSAPTVTISDSTGSGASIVSGVINANTIDVIQVTAVWNNFRYPLRWFPWTDFSANMRGWLQFQQQPCAFTVYGQQLLYIAPLPNQNYQAELDTSVYPDDLTLLTQIEPISTQFQHPIEFYACYILKMKEQSFGEAQWFYDQYQKRMFQVQASQQTRAIPNVLWSR